MGSEFLFGFNRCDVASILPETSRISRISSIWCDASMDFSTLDTAVNGFSESDWAMPEKITSEEAMDELVT
ncbi:hypothetical protein PV328_011077 [Microctonus aethiopoides]|uniref:Uncharacterized protein n=1 Tax=Microctonus aethiopoides TaxID=144406 RepID=A0AA39EUZ3_9HYME|nr:hypothetical protein PV328_011077 [Microctonus aethiopoides]